MLHTETRALAQPQHIFDFAAHTAHALAGIGAVAFRLAHAIDRAATTRRAEVRPEAVRPRDRLGPARREPAEHGVTDAYRIR